MMNRKAEPKRTVLCFVFDRKSESLLMIRKKRGQGAGKVNVPGGKIRAGETTADAAARETREETGITPLSLEMAGELEFYFPENNNWDNQCTVFWAEKFTGELLPETDECSAYWEKVASIPLDKMWDSDRLWIPHLLSGKPFHRVYFFDREDRVQEERILK